MSYVYVIDNNNDLRFYASFLRFSKAQRCAILLGLRTIITAHPVRAEFIGA